MTRKQRKRFGAVTVTFAALLMVACVDETPLAPDPTESVPPAFSHVANSGPGDHLLVLTAEAAPSASLLAAIQSAGGTVMARHDDIGVVKVSGLNRAAAEALAHSAALSVRLRSALAACMPWRRAAKCQP